MSEVQRFYAETASAHDAGVFVTYRDFAAERAAREAVEREREVYKAAALRNCEVADEAAKGREYWQDRYIREVEGLNNEGDPIGGDPPCGLRHRAEQAKSRADALAAELAALRGRVEGATAVLGELLQDEQRALSCIAGVRCALGWDSAANDFLWGPAPMIAVRERRICVLRELLAEAALLTPAPSGCQEDM